jgi:hypothetical protein
MAAFVLFVVAVAGAVVAADLVWENPTVGQVTLLAGRPQGRTGGEPSGRPSRLGHSPAGPAPHRAALPADQIGPRQGGRLGGASGT